MSISDNQITFELWKDRASGRNYIMFPSNGTCVVDLVKLLNYKKWSMRKISEAIDLMNSWPYIQWNPNKEDIQYWALNQVTDLGLDYIQHECMPLCEFDLYSKNIVTMDDLAFQKQDEGDFIKLYPAMIKKQSSFQKNSIEALWVKPERCSILEDVEHLDKQVISEFLKEVSLVCKMREDDDEQ